MHTSEGNCGLETRGNPSPSPNFGDGAGTGTAFSKDSGTVRGGDSLKNSGTSSSCPRKSSKFGDGDHENFNTKFGDGAGIRTT